MKRIIRFSKFFLPAAIISTVLVVSSIVGYFVKGFNLGVDFQAGLIQEVKFAPTAFSLTWSGRGNATLSFDRAGLYIVISGAGIDAHTAAFPFSEYANTGVLAEAMMEQVEGLDVQLVAPGQINTAWLVFGAQGNPYLGSDPYVVHYLDPSSPEISIVTVREALTSLGQTVAVQNLGQPQDRHFMIRIEDKREEGEEGIPAEKITSALEGYFGVGEVVVLRSDFVGSRFSKNLTDQVGVLMALTLLIILVYASIRFKPQYAIGAVIGIVHDALIIVGLVVWSGMEFNTSTIAAVLTILGYSINNTIVIFDRIRETRRIYPDAPFVEILNRSLSATLSRSIITTFTTMLAVLSLLIFTSGAMRDFAIALQVGMISGVYTTTFIASGFINFWEEQKAKKEKGKLPDGRPAKAAISKA
jgi:preprotein translocase subunit SecF